MNYLKRVLLLAILFSLTGCLSKNPLSARGEYVFDSRLLGAWSSPNDGGTISYMHVASSSDKNVLTIVVVTYPKKGDFTVERVEAYAATENEITGYMSIEDNATRGNGYLFARYVFEKDDLLKLCFVPMGNIKDLVKSKKLDGYILNEKTQMAVLTGSVEQLRNYFMSDDAKDIFINCIKLSRI